MSNREHRLRRNEESLSKAEHHREPWSQDEIDLLLTWDRSDEELDVMAELLGRTREACRERFYQVRRGHVRVEVKTTTTVTGWLVGYCFECGRFGDVFSDGTVSLCEECR